MLGRHDGVLSGKNILRRLGRKRGIVEAVGIICCLQDMLLYSIHDIFQMEYRQ